MIKLIGPMLAAAFFAASPAQAGLRDLGRTCDPACVCIVGENCPCCGYEQLPGSTMTKLAVAMPPPESPYETCIRLCRADEIPFGKCHRMCTAA